ncbi:alpha/beta hydrolase [Edaphobacter bradus]|uniref:alpha/beta hydrolase n=1 Tax=Edaphobacter bradus TaxID=2259016 RepID=UPI0021DFBCCD|nr:alpha/beta hydrolase [Edaphobacter bradus]
MPAARAEVVPPAKVVKPPTGFSRTVVLWPRGAPGALGTGEGDIPRLYVYPATGEGLHSAVIVLPGGGYSNLSTEKEGAEEARWLNQRGVTAFVLVYRLGPRYGFPLPMWDGARAIRYVRSQAAELGIDKHKIGVWGFSAGGHLAAYLATTHDAGEKNAADPIERESDRPDFAILSYARLSMDPAIPRRTSLEALIGTHPTSKLIDAVNLEQHVTKDTSPCFLFSTTGDQTVNSMNSTAFYDALKRAGVPAELHIFERGEHGLGMAQGLAHLPELAIYPTLVENWMQIHGWMQEDAADHHTEESREARSLDGSKREGAQGKDRLKGINKGEGFAGKPL